MTKKFNVPIDSSSIRILILFLALQIHGCAHQIDRSSSFDGSGSQDIYIELSPDSEAIISQDELCNGVDDNGNGLIDEGAGERGQLIRPCSTECGSGWQSCINGRWGPCSAPQPGPNGKCRCTEEGEIKRCSTPCGEGRQICEGGYWSECRVEEAGDEICANGVDDDCDGETDEEDCKCEEGQTRPCGTDVGQCQSGTQQCIEGRWGECEGAVEPQQEICNGLDDDCDGEVDNNLEPDMYEENDECSHYENIPDAEEGGVENSIEATLIPEGDVDWYRLKTVEVAHTCIPFTSQCCFTLRLTITIEEGPTPILCARFDECSSSESQCTTEGSSSLVLEYEGECSFNDDRYFMIEVKMPEGQNNCHPYHLTYSFDLE